MSKLFDQLKNAARSREEVPSSGILIDALNRQQRAAAPSVEPGPAASSTGSEPAAAATPGEATRARSLRGASYSGIALAAIIFVVVVFAWHSAPFRVPPKLRIDPSGLKLDRSLDLQRTTPKGTSPAGRPS